MRPDADAVFVYYRVRDTDAAALRSAVAALRVDGHDGPPRLMRRVSEPAVGTDPSGPTRTWMEIWSPADAGPPERLRDAIEVAATRAGLHRLIVGERHYEHFAPCA